MSQLWRLKLRKKWCVPADTSGNDDEPSSASREESDGQETRERKAGRQAKQLSESILGI